MGYQEYLQIVKELNYKFRYYKSGLPFRKREQSTGSRQRHLSEKRKMHCTGAATPAERQSICPASLRMRSEMRSSAGW